MEVRVKCPKCGHEFTIVVIEKYVPEKPKRWETIQ